MQTIKRMNPESAIHTPIAVMTNHVILFSFLVQKRSVSNELKGIAFTIREGALNLFPGESIRPAPAAGNGKYILVQRNLPGYNYYQV